MRKMRDGNAGAGNQKMNAGNVDGNANNLGGMWMEMRKTWGIRIGMQGIKVET